MSAVPVTASRPRAAATWLSERPQVIGLAAILALAAFLDLFRLERNGYANEYYAGAVRSMLESWHNFFFVSFDPGGLVSVDKPPLALWLEAISAKIFGYSGWSILLPEALAGIGAVWLLYLLVARVFGRWAGLAAALALAVSPVSVSVNRDNNPDALLALLLVAAAYVGVRAVESGRLRTLSSAPFSSGSPSTPRCSPRWWSSPVSRSPTPRSRRFPGGGGQSTSSSPGSSSCSSRARG